MKEKVDSCSCSGQILTPIARYVRMRRYGSLTNITPSVFSDLHALSRDANDWYVMALS